MSQDEQAPARLRWARLRFSIIGPLLTSPPEVGELGSEIDKLAAKSWKHPTTGEAFRYSNKTIERLYYLARDNPDPLRALERKVPKHAGTHRTVSPALGAEIERQYREHPRWSYQLHRDNLRVLVQKDLVQKEPSLGRLPSYGTICRYMKDNGWVPQRRRKRGKGSEAEVVPRETRSYEHAYVNALWHFDFHEGKRQVITTAGERKKPYLFGMLDDCSRVCCHAQWYTERENTEDLAHGLSQAIQKR
jgi:putative transposase